MPPAQPLTRHAPASPLAHGPDGPVTAAQFHDDVAWLVEQLPAGGHVLNTCVDPYRFMVGLGACLASGRVTLMPSTLTPATLGQIRAAHPGVLCLGDGQQPIEGLPRFELGLLPPRILAATPEALRINGRQTAAIVFTSGSTGEPTPHAKHWNLLCANARSESQRLGADGMTIIATVPAQHMYGFESSVLLALQGGATLWRGRPFYPADIQAALQATPRPRMLVTTPFHLATVLDSGLAMPPCDLLLSATAPLAPALAERAEAAFGAPLLEIYGCTESGQVASRRTRAGPEWQLLPGVRMDAQGGAAWVHGGHVEGRVRLSDWIEQIDAEHFTLGARDEDMVNVAGKRGSLAALNAHLNAVPGVIDGCFVLPEPQSAPAHEHTPRRLAALVVAPAVGTGQILAALRQRIDPAFLPRPLVKVEALPRNATGKLVAPELARLAWNTSADR